MRSEMPEGTRLEIIKIPQKAFPWMGPWQLVDATTGGTFTIEQPNPDPGGMTPGPVVSAAAGGATRREVERHALDLLAYYVRRCQELEDRIGDA